ncbi:hypothetical protein XELAEV_18027318mg [Xenopus laevis]|uniref:Uncharacterized protein n=1 Tax=Xenopus laevis TaxID=8355 RepID=A0A974HK70_XENLA|nr:hypothetical protein XELAEV_18027318mg [Xenopus laevis]
MSFNGHNFAPVSTPCTCVWGISKCLLIFLKVYIACSLLKFAKVTFACTGHNPKSEVLLPLPYPKKNIRNGCASFKNCYD